MRRWITTYSNDFLENNELRQRTEQLLARLAAQNAAARDLHAILRAQVDITRQQQAAAEDMLLSLADTTLDMARAVGELCLASKAIDVARQLTLIESTLYNQVRPWELLPWARRGAATTHRAMNLALTALRAERVAQWVATLVLWQTTLASRTIAIAFLLEVASECLGLNNFNSIVHIMTGLLSQPVVRLKVSNRGACYFKE